MTSECRTLFTWIGPFLFCLSASAADTIPFTAWLGTWEGSMTVYSATGDRLESRQVQFTSSTNQCHPGMIQKISLTIRSERGVIERQSGVVLSDTAGPRKILKTEKGDTVGDLRGRSLGPAKMYWFDIDSHGDLRESVIESIEGEALVVHGFRWDGKRVGSYRIIEGRYQRRSASVTSPSVEEIMVPPSPAR